MAWVTPPSFAASDSSDAAELNILSDDLVYLKGVADGAGGTVELKASSASVTATLGGVYVVTYTVTFAAGADLNHRINVSVGGEATTKSLGGGVTSQLCVAGIARVSAGATISGSSTGAGTVNSQSIKAARIGA